MPLVTVRESEEISQMREAVARFVAKEMPRHLAREWDKANHFPREVFDRLAKLGVLALSVPEAYGGAGRNVAATMTVIEELSKRSLAVSVPYIMSACYAGMNLAQCGDERQKASLLPKVACGGLLFALGWSEPDVGADLASVRTTAKRVGDRVILDGAKRFCSGATICDYIYVLARTGPVEDRYRNLSLLLVPPATRGVTIRKIDALGMKGALTTDVLFDHVEVPVENIMGGVDGWNLGWPMLVGPGLDVEKLEVAAMALGIAQAAMEDAWEYAGQRVQFGKPITQYQSVQHKLAEMACSVHSARLMLYDAAAMSNESRPCSLESSMAKLHASEVAKSVALECMTIHGAYGYVKEWDVERYVRDALLMPIIGGSSAIQRNNIYKAISRRRGIG
jgi:alkylation response protein AidB-like acyl-CoA dehydrogenase